MSNEINYISKISLEDVIHLLKDEEARELIADILNRESELKSDIDGKLSEIQTDVGLKVSDKISGSQTIDIDENVLFIIDGGTSADYSEGTN